MILSRKITSTADKGPQLGDLVARVAQPIAKASDAVLGTNLANCGGCKARQEKLNQFGATLAAKLKGKI